MLIKTNNSKIVIEYLKKDLIINLNMLGILENVSDVEIFVDNEEQPNGVILRKNYFHYIYTKSDDFINNTVDNFFTEEGFYGFSGVEDSIADKLRAKVQVNWESLCRLYYLPEENFKPKCIKTKGNPVNIKDAEIIDEYYPYRNNYSLAAIKADIENRHSSAIYLDDKIVSWVLIHDDNSMGIMHTRDEYRRRGYGIDVTLDLAGKIIRSGKIPFLQIVKKNKMSPGLAEACGFVEAGGVQWFGIVVGSPKAIIEFNSEVRRGFIELLPWVKELLPDRYIGMYQFLVNFTGGSQADVVVQLKELKTSDDIEAWLSMLSDGYDGLLLKDRIDTIDKTAILDKINTNKLAIFVGYLKGNAVATVTFYQHSEEEWGLFLPYTREEYQGFELEEDFLAAAINSIKERSGYSIALQASEEDEAAFKALGFRSSHRVDCENDISL